MTRSQKSGYLKLESGFTYIEIMAAVAIFSIIISAIYNLFIANIKIYSSEGNNIDLTQGLRAGLLTMTKDIRMAKYDPTGGANPLIITADISEFKFQADFNENGTIIDSSSDPSEELRYALTKDADHDGIADTTPCKLGRASWRGNLQPVVENITKLQFTYYDKDNNLLTPLPLNSEQIENIKSIEICITGESADIDPISIVRKTKTIITRAMIRNAGL